MTFYLFFPFPNYLGNLNAQEERDQELEEEKLEKQNSQLNKMQVALFLKKRSLLNAKWMNQAR